MATATANKQVPPAFRFVTLLQHSTRKQAKAGNELRQHRGVIQCGLVRKLGLR
jgi:hypothetical protein